MTVNDQLWALVIAAATMAAVRLMDFFMPRGRMSRWAKEHSVPAKDLEDDNEEEDEQQ